MKILKSTTVIALLVAVALFAVSCGGGNSKKQSGDASEAKTETKAEPPKGGNTVKFVSAEDDGGRGRVKIVLDKKVSLMTSDVTSSAGEVDMVQNSIGDGMNWLVTITGLTSKQEVTITIKNDKTNTFEPSSRKVTITP